MKLHPRHDQNVKARLAIQEAVIAAVKDFDLTFAELISILAGQINSWTVLQVRSERLEDKERGATDHDQSRNSDPY